MARLHRSVAGAVRCDLHLGRGYAAIPGLGRRPRRLRHHPGGALVPPLPRRAGRQVAAPQGPAGAGQQGCGRDHRLRAGPRHVREEAVAEPGHGRPRARGAGARRCGRQHAPSGHDDGGGGAQAEVGRRSPAARHRGLGHELLGLAAGPRLGAVPRLPRRQRRGAVASDPRRRGAGGEGPRLAGVGECRGLERFGVALHKRW
mmetsp:Transcript_124972/g.350016  ORF Transcript_124972/g.350016 Transcript_124972/m.350016 type:complete len:202 (+) Transcript_124972:1035-1640(+)